MKEIKILIRNLREYPDNFFVRPQKGIQYNEDDKLAMYSTKSGLVICDMNGEQQGFIETGDKEGVVIQ